MVTEQERATGCAFQRGWMERDQEDGEIRQRVSAELEAEDQGAARKPGSCLSGRCRGRRPWSGGPGREEAGATSLRSV